MRAINDKFWDKQYMKWKSSFGDDRISEFNNEIKDVSLIFLIFSPVREDLLFLKELKPLDPTRAEQSRQHNNVEVE